MTQRIAVRIEVVRDSGVWSPWRDVTPWVEALEPRPRGFGELREVLLLELSPVDREDLRVEFRGMGE